MKRTSLSVFVLLFVAFFVCTVHASPPTCETRPCPGVDAYTVTGQPIYINSDQPVTIDSSVPVPTPKQIPPMSLGGTEPHTPNSSSSAPSTPPPSSTPQASMPATDPSAPRPMGPSSPMPTIPTRFGPVNLNLATYSWNLGEAYGNWKAGPPVELEVPPEYNYSTSETETQPGMR